MPEAATPLPPYDDAKLLTEAALLVDWYLPAIAGRPTEPALREEYLALWRALLPAEHLLLALGQGARPTARVARLEATAGWAERLEGIGHG